MQIPCLPPPLDRINGFKILRKPVEEGTLLFPFWAAGRTLLRSLTQIRRQENKGMSLIYLSTPCITPTNLNPQINHAINLLNFRHAIYIVFPNSLPTSFPNASLELKKLISFFFFGKIISTF